MISKLLVMIGLFETTMGYKVLETSAHEFIAAMAEIQKAKNVVWLRLFYNGLQLAVLARSTLFRFALVSRVDS